MRLMDIMLTLPSLLLAIVIVAILGPGLMNAMLAVAIVLLPHYVRIARAAVITEVSQGLRHRREGRRRRPAAADVQGGAAELRGAADRAGDARHLDRDPRRRGARLSRPRRAAAAARMGHHAGRCARIRAARLVGRDVSRASRSWSTVLAFNLLGDGLRDALDPKLKRSERPMAAARDRKPVASSFPSPERRRCARSTASASRSTKGEVLGIVGESGSGKSVGMLALMGLVPYPGRVTRRQADVRRARSAELVRPRAARAHRQGHRDDLPGADDHRSIRASRSASSSPRRCASMKAWTARRRGGA